MVHKPNGHSFIHKLKSLQRELKSWANATFEKHLHDKQRLLAELNRLDSIDDERNLCEADRHLQLNINAYLLSIMRFSSVTDAWPNGWLRKKSFHLQV